MLKFAMKGTDKVIHGAHSRTKLEIRGHFMMQGPQPIGEGGAPQWVADLLESNPRIQQIAVSTKDGGAVWTRIESCDEEEQDNGNGGGNE